MILLLHGKRGICPAIRYYRLKCIERTICTSLVWFFFIFIHTYIHITYNRRQKSWRMYKKFVFITNKIKSVKSFIAFVWTLNIFHSKASYTETQSTEWNKYCSSVHSIFPLVDAEKSIRTHVQMTLPNPRSKFESWYIF